jgi:hypothetical protein
VQQEPVKQVPSDAPEVHAAPSVTGAPSLHTGPPLAQLITPTRHVFAFPVHAAPSTHATHAPALHTPPGHAVPVPTFPFSTHTALPVAQSMAPVLHGFAGVHAAP